MQQLKFKLLMEEIKNRLHKAKKRISELEDGAEENILNGEKRVWKMQNRG